MWQKYFYPLLFLSFLLPTTVIAQQKDTVIDNVTGKYFENYPPDFKLRKKKKFYQTGLFKATIVPAALIGYGLSTFRDHGIYSSYDAYRDIKKLHFKGTHIDDYLQYAPYAELVALNILQLKSSNDYLNTTLLIIKSELLMNAILWPLKRWTKVVRPDSMEPARTESFPSGHTANAFVAASIVHKEFKHLSPWYGVGAYTIATSVGIFRMLNNRHWQTDVFVGAGIGMLSVHLAYLTHRYWWGRKPTNSSFLLPFYNQGAVGLCMFKTF